MVIETLWSYVWQSQIFLKDFFCLKNLANGPKIGQKQGLLRLKEKFGHYFHWIYSKIKIYIIRCLPAQVQYFGSIFFQRYRPKCSQATILQDFQINYFPRTNATASFFACWFKFTKIKSCLKSFWFDMPTWCLDSIVVCIPRMNKCN